MPTFEEVTQEHAADIPVAHAEPIRNNVTNSTSTNQEVPLADSSDIDAYPPVQHDVNEPFWTRINHFFTQSNSDSFNPFSLDYYTSSSALSCLFFVISSRFFMNQLLMKDQQSIEASCFIGNNIIDSASLFFSTVLLRVGIILTQHVLYYDENFVHDDDHVEWVYKLNQLCGFFISLSNLYESYNAINAFNDETHFCYESVRTHLSPKL